MVRALVGGVSCVCARLCVTRNGRVFILGKENGPVKAVCKDDNCRGFGRHHEANCKENAIVRKVRNNRIVASKAARRASRIRCRVAEPSRSWRSSSS